MDDMQLFDQLLPHLTFFLDVAKNCGLELKDSMSVGQPQFLES